jgi:hypothetical protein
MKKVVESTVIESPVPERGGQRMQRKWRWVTRDNDKSGVDVWDQIRKPVLADGSWLQRGEGDLFYIPAVEFKALFGFLPDPAKPEQVEFTARRVKR